MDRSSRENKSGLFSRQANLIGLRAAEYQARVCVKKENMSDTKIADYFVRVYRRDRERVFSRNQHAKNPFAAFLYAMKDIINNNKEIVMLSMKNRFIHIFLYISYFFHIISNFIIPAIEVSDAIFIKKLYCLLICQ